MPEKRQRTVYAYDYENNKFLSELFYIASVTTASYKVGNYSDADYTVIGQNESLVYLLNVSPAAEEYGFTEEKIKEMFVVIEENV